MPTNGSGKSRAKRWKPGRKAAGCRIRSEPCSAGSPVGYRTLPTGRTSPTCSATTSLAALSDPEKRKAIFDSVGELLSGIASLFKGEGGDGIGGALSGIFGGLFGGGREHGGSVDSGKVYVVGERGPELYSPGRDGSIIPNSALGGDTFHMTFAMDRMDDRNFVATFAKNAPKIVEGIAHQMTRQGVRRK